jgi:hypothetical protein
MPTITVEFHCVLEHANLHRLGRLPKDRLRMSLKLAQTRK